MKELALHILDVAENGVSAGAEHIGIELYLEQEGKSLCIEVEDNGRGMATKELARTSDPFYTSRTTRKVGLGIPLFRQHAEMTGGKLVVFSQPGRGTKLRADIFPEHPDCQPLGDLEGCWILLVTAHPKIEWALKLTSAQGKFSISTAEIKSELELDIIEGTQLTEYLKRLIRNNIYELGLN